VNPCLSDDILCAYLDGAIAPKDAIGAPEHMAECATCAARAQELGQIMKLMGVALDAELYKDAPTEKLNARFKAFLNEASAPFTPAKSVAPSLSHLVPGSAPRLLEWFGRYFRRPAFASVIVVSIAIVVALAIGAWRSGLLKTGADDKATQKVNSTDSTDSQAQTPDLAHGKTTTGEQTTANNQGEHTASTRAGMARPTHENRESRLLKSKPKESRHASGGPGESPSVASIVATGDGNESGGLDKAVNSRAKIGAGGAPSTISGVNGSVGIRRENLGENTISFRDLARGFVSDANPIAAPHAQKPEKELQTPDSAQVQNPPVALPPTFGPIRKVELSPEANSWAVQIISRGGFAGTGRGDLTITSQGRLDWNGVENQCNVKLREDLLQTLSQTALSANASGWSKSTASLCADCYVTAIVLQRREGAGMARTYIAYWDDATAGNISENLKKVYDTFMTHKGCKQDGQ
jgi:hypothetical protein